MELTWLFMVKLIILFSIMLGVSVFVLKKVFFDSTQGAMSRLNKEREVHQAKQTELNEKIKQANEELDKRRGEANALVAKMKEEAEAKAKEEAEKIINKARQTGEEVINKAQHTKEELRKAIEKEMSLKTVDFTLVILAQVLTGKGMTALNESLICEFLDGLEQVDMSMIGEGVNVAEVMTSIPLDEKLKTRLADILKKKLEREISVNGAVEPKLIAGIVLKFATLSLDGSLKSMLIKTSDFVKDKIDKGLLKV